MQRDKLRYKYDYMRFPIDEEAHYEVVVRTEDDREHAYDIYIFQPEIYSYSATILHHVVDLSNFDDDEIEEALFGWGYKSMDDFKEYLKNETVVHNYELRLVTCITENTPWMKPETLMDGDYDECFDFLTDRLGGRSPLDDTDESTEGVEDSHKKSKFDVCKW